MTAEQLKKARLSLGFDQKEMAEALGWSGPQQISNLESGRRPVMTQTALAIECILRRRGLYPMP
jgi:transcriptional regulator with XRE-family HTH domain